MPAWLLQILITIAIKIGVPALLKYFPGVPQQVVDIINQLLDSLKDPKQSNSAAKKIAISSVKDFCTTGCESDTKQI